MNFTEILLLTFSDMITNDTIDSSESTLDDSEETQEKPEKEFDLSKVDFAFLKTGLALNACKFSFNTTIQGRVLKRVC